MLFIWNSDLKATWGASPPRSEMSQWDPRPIDAICKFRAQEIRLPARKTRLQQTQLVGRHETGKQHDYKLKIRNIFRLKFN